MTKSAIKKYTERLGFFGMILHYIGRFMTKTEQQVIGKLTVRFGKVKKNRLVFKNREMMDCTDNPEAFYEYLISSGYNKKYEIIWLVSEKRKFRNELFDNCG
jgi:CDP-glycerol glycerophosphotransferase